MSKIIIENLAKMNIGRQEMIKNGFSGQKYDDVQRGKSSYKLEDVISISKKFHLSLDYLVYGEKSPVSELTDEEQECVEKFRMLSEQDQWKEIGRMEVIYEGYTPEEKEAAS